MELKETILRYRVDNGEVHSAIAENIQLQERASQAAKDYGKDINQALDKGTRGYDDINKSILENAQVISKAAKAVKGYEDQIVLLEKKQEGLKKSSLAYKAIDREIKDVKKSLKELNSELSETGIEFEKTGKSGLNLMDGFKKMKGAAVGFFAAVGAAGGLKVLISVRMEIDKQTRSVRQLSGATKAASREIALEIRGIAKTYQKDFNEVLIASNTVAKEFEITQTEALKRIREGFRAGSDINGEFLDTLREYPAQFKAAKVSADQMFQIINQSVKQGIYSDKGPDVLKEATLRIREMTKATSDALKGIGLNSREIEQDLISGQSTIFEVIQQVSQRLSELPEDSKIVGTAIADIFGGPGEDAGLKFLRSLKDIDGQLDTVESEVNGVDEATEEFSKAVDNLAMALTGGGGGLSHAIEGVVKIGAGFINFLSGVKKTRISNELEAQRIKMLSLTSQVLNLEEGTSEYKRGIDELKKTYPDYLGQLDKDTTTHADLKKAIDAANESLKNKILVQRLDEEAIEAATKAADAAIKVENRREDLRDQVVAALDKQGLSEEYLGKTLEEQVKALEELNIGRDAQLSKSGELLGFTNKYAEELKNIAFLEVVAAKAQEENAKQTERLNRIRKALNLTTGESSSDGGNEGNLPVTSVDKAAEEIAKLPDRFAYRNNPVYQLVKEGFESASAELPERLQKLNESLGQLEGAPVQKGKNKKSFLQRLLGITPDEQEAALDALKTALSSFRDILESDAALRINIADQNIASLDAQIRAQENSVKVQAKLAEAGLANNLETAEEEVGRLQVLRNRELANKREALREQARLETIQQAINLITASAEIFKAFSSIPVVGVPLAIAAIGTMFTAFGATKAKASQATQQEFYEGGFSDEGGFTGDGIATQESKRVGDKPYKYHKGEYIMNHENTTKFRPLLEGIESGSIKSMLDLPSTDPLKGRSVTGFNLKALEKAKSRDKAAVMSQALKMNNKGIERRLESLEKTNRSFHKWMITEAGVSHTLPDGSTIIHRGNTKTVVKKKG